MYKLKMTKDLYDELSKMVHSKHDEKGREIPNPKPKIMNVSVRPPSLQEQIQRLLRVELSRQVQDQGAETFDEANDLDVPEEDPMPLSGYEVLEDEYPIPKPSLSNNPKQPPAEAPQEAPEPPSASAEPGA